MKVLRCCLFAVSVLLFFRVTQSVYEDVLFEKDLYKMLGIARDATQRDIRSKYRRLAKKYHPDKQSNDTNHSSNRFIVLSEAVNILSDEETREKYDRQLQFAAQRRRHQQTYGDHSGAYNGRPWHHHPPHPPRHAEKFWDEHHMPRRHRRQSAKTKEQQRKERLLRKNWRAERRARRHRQRVREAAKWRKQKQT